jgi:hypothetical protein
MSLWNSLIVSILFGAALLAGCASLQSKSSPKLTNKTAAITRLESPETFAKLAGNTDPQSLGFCAVFSTAGDKIYFQNSRLFSDSSLFVSKHIAQYDGLDSKTIDLLQRLPNLRELRCGKLYKSYLQGQPMRWGFSLRTSERLQIEEIEIVSRLISRNSFLTDGELQFLSADLKNFELLYRPLMSRSIGSQTLNEFLGTEYQPNPKEQAKALNELVTGSTESRESGIDALESRILSNADSIEPSHARLAFGHIAASLLQTESRLHRLNTNWRDPLVLVPFSVSLHHLTRSLSVDICSRAASDCNLRYGSACQMVAGRCVSAAQTNKPESISSFLNSLPADKLGEISTQYYVENLIAKVPLDETITSKIRTRIAVSFGSIENLLFVPFTPTSSGVSIAEFMSMNPIIQTRSLPGFAASGVSSGDFLTSSVTNAAVGGLSQQISAVYGAEIGRLLERRSRSSPGQKIDFSSAATSLAIRPLAAPMSGIGSALLRPGRNGSFEVLASTEPLNFRQQNSQPGSSTEQVWFSSDSDGKLLRTRLVSYSSQIFPRAILLNDQHLRNLSRRIHAHFQSQIADSEAEFPRRLWVRFLADKYGDVSIFAATSL